MADRTVAALANVTVLDGDAREHRLGDCWARQPVVLVLIRHFGCLFCKEQVAEFAKVTERIHGDGAELVVVGNGGPEHVNWFREYFGVKTPVFTDPTKEAYRLAGARHGLFTGANPRTFAATLRALRKGYRQSGTRGDAHQQGGVFVVLPDGSLPYRYVSKFAGDHPHPEDVADVLEQAVGRLVSAMAGDVLDG